MNKIEEYKETEQYSKPEGYKETEAYAQQEEKEENEWQERYGSKIPEQIEKINKLLQSGKPEDKLKLHELFHDKSFFDNYKKVDEFAVMYVILYAAEVENGEKTSILDQGENVAELCSFFEKLKFLLYRLDFIAGTETETEVLDFIKKYHVSMSTLNTMLISAVLHPMQVALKLEGIYRKNNMYAYQFSVLLFIQWNWPGNYRICMSLADLYLKTGNAEAAQEYLNKIPIIPESMKHRNARLFELQELIWMLRYEEYGIPAEIVSFIMEHQISAEMSIFLLKLEERMKPQLYLLLADEMIKSNLDDMAWDLLVYADTIYPGNELVICLMAKQCIKRNQLEDARRCLEKVETPGEVSRKLQEYVNRAGRGNES